MRDMPMKSSTRPTRNISLMSMRLVPNTIVLAAVATGSINPKDAAKVAGIINSKGGKFKSFCKATMMGMANWILAIFDANSLIVVTMAQIPKIIKKM